MRKLANLKTALLGAFLVMAAPVAFAEEPAIDVSAVTDAISGHGTILVAIGAAVLGVLYLARVFSWGRKI